MENNRIFQINIGSEIDRLFDDSSLAHNDHPKAVILMGGSGERRAVKVLQPCARKIGMTGLSLSTACTLLCADGKTPEATQRLLSKMMTMEAKYPEECNRARADSWAKLVDFFQTW